MTTLRVAAVQCRTDFSIGNNVQRVCDYLEQAKNRDVDVVLFPEAMITGYDFSKFSPDHYEKCNEALTAISEKCASLSINCIIGLIYKKKSGDRYVNSAVCINRIGDDVPPFSVQRIMRVFRQYITDPKEKRQKAPFPFGFFLVGTPNLS